MARSAGKRDVFALGLVVLSLSDVMLLQDVSSLALAVSIGWRHGGAVHLRETDHYHAKQIAIFDTSGTFGRWEFPSYDCHQRIEEI